METFDDIHRLPENFAGAVYAIGNFDGLHRGHQAVIDAALKARAVHDQASTVISFEPPPRAFFRPQAPLQRLTLPNIKAKLIDKMGVDFLLNLPFNQSLVSMSAEDFVHKILNDKLSANYIAVGENFRFGAERKGDVDLLKTLARARVEIIAPIRVEGETVSSTAIREALAAGNPQKAANLLGRWWQIKGAVIRGDQRGRMIGFPTLNLSLKDYAWPRSGVYAARCFIKARWFDAVANIGVRPTFGEASEPLLEAHLFATDEDFYDQEAQVFLLDFIRPEKKFDDVAALKDQISQDSEVALKIHARLAQKNPYPFWEIR